MTIKKDDSNNNQSAFNQRSDRAGLVLKQELAKKLGIELPSTQVEVGPDGKPPPPLPPEGSYARNAYEAQMAEQAQQAQQPQPAPEPEPQAQQPPPQPEPPQQPQEPQISENAQSRIRELVAQLKAKDSEVENLRQAQEASQQTLAEMQASQKAMEAQYQSVVDQHLEALDPETRAMVIADSRIQEAVQRSNQQLLQAIAPRLEKFEQSQRNQEMSALGNTYPGFDPTVHPQYIEAFMEKNPNCSVEQAFRAIARPEELAAQANTASPVPPSIPPGSGPSTPRYVPTQEQSDPDQELADEAALARELRRSSDPAERKLGLKAFDANLRKRLFGAR